MSAVRLPSLCILELQLGTGWNQIPEVLELPLSPFLLHLIGHLLVPPAYREAALSQAQSYLALP